jgi:hypothetical protein
MITGFVYTTTGCQRLGRHYVADTVLKKETMVEERRFESAAAATNLPPPMEFYMHAGGRQAPVTVQNDNRSAGSISKRTWWRRSERAWKSSGLKS